MIALNDITLKPRFEALVVNNLWTGATRSSDGKAFISSNGLAIDAQALALFYSSGAWPEGYEVLCSTGNPLDMDATHLSWVLIPEIKDKVVVNTTKDNAVAAAQEALTIVADNFNISYSTLVNWL